MSKEKTKIKKFYIGVEPMILKNGNSDDRNSFNRVYKDIFDHLTNDDNKYDEIHIYINNNPGGDFRATMGLIELIKTSRVPVITYAIGNVSSAAALLFMSGHSRYMYPNSKLMFHGVLLNKYPFSGNISKLKHLRSNFKDSNKYMKKYLKKFLSKKDLKKIFDKNKDLYIGYKKALKKGLITNIIK